MTTPDAGAHPDPQEVLALVRDRLLLDTGMLDQPPRPFYGDVIPDLWIAPVFDGDRGRVAVVYAPGGHPVAQAGLDRASSRLRALGLLERDPAWVAENLRPILDAVGGLSPGQAPHAEEAPGDGGIVLRFETTAEWAAFAAGGARGAPPDSDGPDARGIAPPPTPGTMEVAVDDDYGLRWTYAVDGAVVGSFSGHWSQDDGQSAQLSPLFAERLVATARVQAESPLAVAGAPVRRLYESGASTVWAVELLGQDTVEITVSAGVPGSRT